VLHFPRPFPDELLGSLVGRACRETGLSHKELVFSLANVRGTYSSIFLPSYIRQLATLTKIDAEKLVYAHSAFPYIVSFMANDLAARLKDLVLSRVGISGGSFHSLTQSVTNGVAYRRLCRHCAQEDLSRFGTSYWHRSHMLPAVHYCAKHRQPLEETRIAVRNFGRLWSYCMPHEVKGACLDFGLPAWVLMEIASRSVVALEKHADYRDSWSDEYRRLAEDKGYVTPGPFIAGRQLACDIRAAYGPDFLAQADCTYTKERNAWPALMVRPRTKGPFSPVKHILLRTFLENCSTGPKLVNQVKCGRKPRDSFKLDEQLSKRVEAGLRRFHKRLHRLTLAEFMSECGCWSQYRHARNRLPKTASLVEAFKAASRTSKTS
jgi:hypothetical protein